MIIIITKQNYIFSLPHTKFFFGSDLYSDNGQAQNIDPAGIPQGSGTAWCFEINNCEVTS